MQLTGVAILATELWLNGVPHRSRSECAARCPCRPLGPDQSSYWCRVHAAPTPGKRTYALVASSYAAALQAIRHSGCIHTLVQTLLPYVAMIVTPVASIGEG